MPNSTSPAADKQTLPQPAGDSSIPNQANTLPAELQAVDGTLGDAKPKSGSKSQSTDIVEQAYIGEAELTYTESAYVPDSLRRPYNPDPIVQRNQTYRIYEEMLEDDQINVAMQIKKTLVCGSGWYIETENEEQKEIKKDLEIIYGEQCDRPFTDIIEEILQCYEFGFSIGEKIFRKRSDGTLCLRDCKVRHPATWLLHTDRQGNMVRYEQRGLYETLDVNPDSLVHTINNPKHQNPYGRSDLFPCYAPWLTKRHIIRFYAIFLEKAASPTPVAKYDRRAPKDVVDDMFAIIKKFQTKTAIVIPKEFEIDFLESKSTGDAYIKGINLFNMLIGRALFIPDLLGFQGSETGGGSYALGKDQIGMIFRHISRRREVIERLVDTHFTKAICMYNWGMTEDFPKFKFKPLSDEDIKNSATEWVKAINGKTWKPTLEEVNHFRQILKFPESEEIELYDNNPIDAGGMDANGNPISDKPGDESGGAGGEGGKDSAGDSSADGNADDKSAEASKGPGAKGGADEGGSDVQKKGSAEDTSKEPEGAKKAEVKKKFSIDEARLKAFPGSYKKKVDFAASDNILRASVDKILHDAEPIVSDILEDLYDQMQKKKIIVRQDLEKANSIELKYLKRLQLVFKKHFRRLYEDSKSQAATEVKKGEHAMQNIPNDEFLDFLDQETFKYVGDWEYMIASKVKQELIKAIKDGKPLSEVVGIMDTEGNDLSDTSLERYARTKGTEVYNRGRLEYFESTGVVSAYQYAAILDDRTSEICEGLDGCIFDKADAPVPPMHFNCRSMLIPITEFEDYTVDEKANDGSDIDDFIEENIGKGFPKN